MGERGGPEQEIELGQNRIMRKGGGPNRGGGKKKGSRSEAAKSHTGSASGGGGGGRGGKPAGARSRSPVPSRAPLPASGARAQTARTLRAFTKGDAQTFALDGVARADLAGCVEVVRLMGLYCRLEVEPEGADALRVFVARGRFRPPTYVSSPVVEAGCAPVKMEDWIGIVWQVLAERGTVCRANELFASLPKLQSLFTQRFKSAAPLLKAGCDAGVFFAVKVTGAQLVQLRVTEIPLPVPIVVKPVALAPAAVKRPADKPKATRAEKGPAQRRKGPVQAHSSSPCAPAVATSLSVPVVAVPMLHASVAHESDDDEPTAELFAISVEAPRAGHWMCTVCESDNVLSAKCCEVCLTDRE